MAATPSLTATLLVACRDRTGLVAALSNFVFQNGGNILDADQHAESESGEFFMRLVWDLNGFGLDRQTTQAGIEALARQFDLRWELSFSDVRPRVAVMVSKASHCLYDLMLCQQLGDLGGEIVGVVSNHDTLADVCRHFDVPLTVIPVERDGKVAAEAGQLALLDELRIDLVVLARYMQILSAAFVERWQGRIINIHHSFLPAFAGARPYHQAQQRGVKVIGATAHYVTADLDQGPIIEQDVCRVSHRDTVEDMMRKGRELERLVLTRAVRLHLQRRVLVSGNRTIVFG
ncbi:MAG TPA: formyltetrahydrofolate deformylase [Polyangia bacterium]|jgi:formyltetrahydrofolate deformylase|nr:formyltetrahydrofolate deformylase [Polyangia bacterium]